MTTPDPYPWLLADEVADHLRVLPGSLALEAAAIERARRATASWIEEVRPGLRDGEGTYVATPAVLEAAVILSARFYARTGSPLGVATFGEFAQEVIRSDPDVALLLGLGRYAKPAIG